ncbi:MAG: phosphoribosylanthranilate isomerase [Alphaproteobacteria bacterium]
MTGAKICGVSTPEAVSAAIEGGAQFLGFNFFPKSPRYVTPERAAQLAAPARGRNIGIVAVTVDPDDDLVDRIVTVLKPDLIQLHGSETPQRTVEVRTRSDAGIIKVLPVSGPDDFAAAWGYEPFVEHMLFDARTPKGSDLPGGMGVRFDWTLLKGRSFPRPYFLAGGLDPWNVAEAIAQSGAPLVDVSSGVERGAGLKDPTLISAFLAAVART